MTEVKARSKLKLSEICSQFCKLVVRLNSVQAQWFVAHLLVETEGQFNIAIRNFPYPLKTKVK